MQSNQSNAAKLRHGNSLNKQVENLIKSLLQNKKIKNFIVEPKYNYPSKKKKQFNPDGEITKLNGDLIIYDNTTSIRSDRLKQKSWDAYGVKEHFKLAEKNVKYYVIIPNNLKSKEQKKALKESKKLHNNQDYFNTIDNILTISELIKII